ncbi:unnamed protein product [Rotaria sp. Silwood2]|nr:unnamed protein product [Rotaria sp. Silwood2]
MIALLLCEINANSYELNYVNRILLTIINELLIINPQSKQLNDYLQLFLSTIVLKRSWNFLFNLLKSENIQRLNHQWTTTLYRLLEFKQIKKQNKYLQLYHQIQFTLSSKTDSSIFPKLHEPYQELKNIVDTCVRNTTEENQWNILLNWIQLKTNSYPYQLELEEIKVMLILNIYYEYYCNNQLSSINTLLEIIENNLQLSSEELRIFRIFLKPEQYMIGYPKENNNDKNFLNDLFKLDCQDEFELSLRHMLVNLMAMILLGGKQSFLWTFMFQPLTLQKTYGFGSTSRHTIQSHSVHYDCGCIISQNGDLLQFSNRGYESALNVPAIYVVFFSTFGALAWHLLLFDESVQNLHVPILSPTAIADNASIYRLGGDNLRAKVCSFVCTRLLSTFHFLTIQSNLNDACILLTHCFEQMSFLTQTRNSWIKPLYTTIDDQLQAEQEYNDNVFYFVYNNLVHYKSYINQLNSQSEIQINLQNFIDQMPIVIQFQYFKTELYRLKNSQISLKILQHTINSFSFLKITKLIYDLSQFYLLLHQTYTQLIEQNEFSTITLKELFNRSQKCYNHSYYQKYKNQDKTHQSIIDKGIQAVNIYHQFTNGFIRPGACEEIQHFSTISFDTPVNYLVTNENHDEGDIIMRILRLIHL